MRTLNKRGQSRDGPLVRYGLTGHVFNKSDGVLADAILLNQIIQLRGQHGLQEVLTIRNDDPISVSCGIRVVGSGVSTRDDFFYREKLQSWLCTPNRLVIAVTRVESLADAR